MNMTSTELRTHSSQPTAHSAEVVVRSDGLPTHLLLAKAAIERGLPDQARGLLDEATIGQVEQLLSADPSRLDVMAMLGLMFFRIHRLDEAERWLRRLLEHRSDRLALQQMAEICRLTGRFCQATAFRRRAMAQEPDDVEIRRAYAFDLMREGRFSRGISLLRGLAEANAGLSELHGQWLFQMHYLPQTDPRWLSEQYRQWGERHMPRAWRGRATTGRRIRSGPFAWDSLAAIFAAIPWPMAWSRSSSIWTGGRFFPTPTATSPARIV